MQQLVLVTTNSSVSAWLVTALRKTSYGLPKKSLELQGLVDYLTPLILEAFLCKTDQWGVMWAWSR